MRFGLIIILLFAFSISLALAIPIIQFQNEEFQPDETILAKIFTGGEFIKAIDKSDIKFYEGRKEIFFEYDLKQYDTDYYFYAIINKEGIFTLQIKDILYNEGGDIDSITIEKNLSVEKKIIREDNKIATKILRIRPGVIFTQNSARIDLTNMGNLTLNISYLENEITLLPGELRSININPKVSFSFFEISTYKDFSIPLIYAGEINNNSGTNNETANETTKNTYLTTNIENLSINLIAEKSFTQNISLINFGEKATNIKFKSNFYFIKDFDLKDIGKNSTFNLQLDIETKDAGNFEGFFNISYTQYEEERTISIPVNFVVLSKGSNETDFEPTGKTCREFGGRICEVNDICSKPGIIKYATDVKFKCCVGGTCVAPEEDNKSEPSYNTWALGLIVLIILGIGVYYVYSKYSKTQPKSGRQRIIDRSNEYGKRISGGVART